MGKLTFVIATNNENKLREMREILSGFNFRALSLREAGVFCDIPETGQTFEENAEIKASAAVRMTGLPAIADDSGLCVNALGGQPGVFSARYGGADIKTDKERYMFLLDELENTPDGERGAAFVCAVACVFPDGRKLAVKGVCEGAILRRPRGTGGFGYDPVFYIEKERATMAELGAERKNEISHRAKALRALAELFREEGAE